MSGVWANWHQTNGKAGYPAIYVYLGEREHVLRTNPRPVDDGEVWTQVSAAVAKVRTRSKWRNVNIAALIERSQRQEVSPEFLAHLASNN